MATRVRSYSKVNLGLAIGPQRTDGYHPLATVYQTLALHDEVTVKAHRAARTSIRLTTTDARVPTDAGNTAWQMAERALADLGIGAEVHIHIEKKLPVQGGLGGGSANAVAALVGLERELGAELSGPERLRLAGEIGSDVPLFLVGGTVLGLGRGERVYPLPDLPPMPCVVAIPAIGVSTPQAFRDWDERHAASLEASLTGRSPSSTIEELSRSVAAAFSAVERTRSSSGVFSTGEGLAGNPLLALVRTGIENGFEEAVFSRHPSLGDIKRVLAGPSGSEEAAVYAALSGSGSALFGIYATQHAAEAAVRRLKSRGIAAAPTATLPRDGYWRSMVEEA